MKKLIFIISLIALLAIGVQAQRTTVSNLATDTVITNTETNYSASILLSGNYFVAVQVVCDSTSGNPAGVASLQGSLDNTNWIDISGKTLSLNGSGTYSTIWEYTTICVYKYLRVKYANTGTGVVTCDGDIMLRPYQ